MTTSQQRPQDPPPMKAGDLASFLMEHPDATIRITMPREMYVLVATFWENDGSLTPPDENGVFSLTVSFGRPI